MAYAFDEDTALGPLAEPGRFTAGISHRWDTVGPPNGGFLLALVAKAMARTVPFPDPITLTGHFLRPARHSPVDISVEQVRAGGAHATAMGRLHQDGIEILRTLATFADLGKTVQGGSRRRDRGDTPRPPGGPTHSDAGPPALPPPEDCVPIAELGARQWDDLPGRLPVLYRSIDIRVGRPERPENEVARVEGWVRFTDGREPDVAALPLLADVFPPAVFDVSDASWVPTVELTVHVRGRPAPGWIAASFRTKFLSDGYFEEDGELWDSTGRLVALSRQLALTRDVRPAG
jgi:acyl-CoA thioesterase